jgi:hypothetical protein
MDLISNIGELRTNIKKLEKYMISNDAIEKAFHRNLIRLGINFIAHKKNGEYFFAPSRFIGYKNNSMNAHINNKSKDGKITTPKINEILGFQCNYNPPMDTEYRKFCDILGFLARDTGTYGKKRKFWVISI